MRMVRIILIIFLLVGIQLYSKAQFSKAPEKGFVSWLPAAKWEDALLTGNGTIGAMVMGNPFEESIILNHALLFLPNETPVIPPDMTSHLEEIKRLSLEGKYKEVAELGVKLWKDAGYGDKKWTDPYVPSAELTIDMPFSNVEDYQRLVNFQTAEAIVEWKDQSGYFSRKTFASRADGVIVTQIKGSEKINTEILLHKYPHSWEQSQMISELIKTTETLVKDGFMQYHVEYGKSHSYSPDGYDCLSKVITKGGEVEEINGRIKVTDADEVLILTSIELYKGNNENTVAALKNRLNNAGTDYSKLLQNQLNTHGELYNRVNLNLHPSEEEKEMTSETLVGSVKKKSTPGILQRQFEAARYNILCSTGTNPPNLQGIWSGTWTPGWCSDFTHDGNVEVAISNLLNGNMPELMMAYFNYHERMMEDYKTNAKQFYGARGIHVPSHTSTHGLNNHYDETWCMEYWNGGAGWTASYFYDYYLYTGDQSFLKEHAFPFMDEALMFWEDFLTMGDDGKYIVVPSYSPENNPLEHRWQNCVNATMDVMIIKELTRNWISAAKILGLSSNEIKKKEVFLSHLPDYQIGEDGVLKEWMWKGLTDNQSHRHASHLYGLYEVPDPEILASKQLQNAVQKTINERMKIRKQQQGGEMAFGMCHLGFAAVNIEDKETASEILEYLSRFYWTNSMATTHNPGELFNMDISGGIPSLMIRMLVNSRPGHISLFSATPEDWKEGELSGVLARGNIYVDSIKWDQQQASVQLTSKISQKISVSIGDGYSVNDMKVDGAKYKVTDNELILFLKQNEIVNIGLVRSN
ncbi:glycosyl hydrolase family 95 catalytic domain-containing protein [Plebeiibacterium sediminum]|uniref:Glycoside hydrolase family 95 protein n=1 Tax=Plebeiibacterium sediminum TaxID=2992112 RepID=A0AAE3M402_9BACT|nr:glycoside hydrolase N-terminal domain-containing protein [Plebeiobacterium sediminum]MCW3786591.1 glycoside hydrolase family 95 protein [Plebeiobacterium sediminum]